MNATYRPESIPNPARRIAEVKLARCRVYEILLQLRCSLRTVTLRLKLIRKKCQQDKGLS